MADRLDPPRREILNDGTKRVWLTENDAFWVEPSGDLYSNCLDHLPATELRWLVSHLVER